LPDVKHAEHSIPSLFWDASEEIRLQILGDESLTVFVVGFM